MAQQIINVGTTANDGTGDKPRAAGIKINENFTELYARQIVFLGLYASLGALETAHPTADSGQYAIVDAGPGTDAIKYIWDEDEGWIAGGGTGASVWGDLLGTLSDQTDLQTALNLKSDALVTRRSVSGSHTLDATDLSNLALGKSYIIQGDDTGDITIPPNATVGIPVGSFFAIRGFVNAIQGAAVTVTPDSGDLELTLTSGLEKTATNTWLLHNGSAGGVNTVSGDGVDNTDPFNPVIDLSSYYTAAEADTEITNAINSAITQTFNDKTDSYTLVLADFDTPTFLRVTKTGAATITVPTNANEAVPVGRALIVKKVGSGDLTFSPDTGVTIVPSSGAYTSKPNQQVVLLKEGTNSWGLYNGIAIDASSLGLVPDTRQVAGNALSGDITITTLIDALGIKRKKVLPGDVTNNNATPDTLQDITALSFAVTANVKYYFRFFITYTAAAGTTGSRWSINGPTLTYTNFNVHFATSGTAQTDKEGLVAYDTGGTVSTTSASLTGNIAIIEGVIECSAGGNVIARFASEIASSAIIAKAGFSFVEWMVITDKP